MTSIKNLSCLIESSKIIDSGFSLSKILKTVTKMSQDILEAEAGSLMLLNEQEKTLTFAVALGKKGHKLKKNIKIKLGQGIAGLVAKTGVPILVKDAAKDKRFCNLVDKFSGFKTRSILCVPLKVKGRVIGVLEAINSHHKQGFSTKDIDLFQAFACQVAIAIDNAKLHKQIIEEQKLKQELGIARLLQQSLLPETVPDSDIKISATNIPAEQIGGDLYDFFDLENNKVGVMISDVSGKGIPAALYMVRIISEFRFSAKTESNLGNLLEKINDILLERSILGMFVTLFYLVIDKTNRTIEYISAGHPPPLFYSKESNDVTYLDKAQNPPLGIRKGLKYNHHKTNLNQNNSILFYTDGVTEARDKKGLEFTQKRLVEIFFNSIKKNDNNRIIEDVLHSLFTFTSGAKQHDDCTLVSINI
jgi:sigma-B regulation protein RsbU (phosphoserine phosphatase)